MKRWALPILAVLLIPGIVHADPTNTQKKRKKKSSESDWYQKFRKDFTDYDTDIRMKAARALDAEDPKQFEQILKRVLKDPDWYVRRAGQTHIAKVSSEARFEEALEALEKDKSLQVREGIIVALGIKKDPAYIPLLVNALEKDKTHVRISAARALGRIEDKACIEALITTMENEDLKYRVFLAVRQGLERLTGKYLGAAAVDWRNWWEGHKENYDFEEEIDEEEIRRAEEAGHKLKDEQKTVAGVRLDFRVKGMGAPLVVLPEYGFTGKYMEDYLDPLAKTARIYFCNLPPLSNFEKLERDKNDWITYPVDQLCDAFAKWMKDNGQRKIGILADQQSCWVAMRFASKYPRHVAQMILLSPNSGVGALNKQTQQVIDDAKRRKNPDLQHHAQFHQFNQQTGEKVYTPKDDEERRKFEPRLHFTLWWAGQFDTSIGLLINQGLRKDTRGGVQAAGVAFVNFEMTSQNRVSVPTLILWGKRTPRYQKGDVRKIQKFYRNSKVHIFEKSANVPFIEENEAFISVVRSFIKSSRKGKS
ncbi:MAG: HEAT repeat domain-containing protein [Planctomycetota bacterium]|nr:HEAT repeat domain-containing protein [Planctomycetota bacterium]